MEMSEDIDNLDPRDFNAKSRWKRVVILLAGGLANIIAAFIIIIIVTSNATGFTGTTISHIRDDFPNEGAHVLMPGDTLVSIDGHRLYYANDISMFTQLAGSGNIDLVVRRGGETLTMNNFSLWFDGIVLTHLIDGFIPNLGVQELMVDDVILSINNQQVVGSEGFSTILQGLDGEPVDIVLRRDGEIITLNDFPLRRHEYTTPDGQTNYIFGISFAQRSVLGTLTLNHIEATAGEILRVSLYEVMNNVRLIRVSLAMLFSGAAGIGDMGGVVAIVDLMNTIGQEAPTFVAALTRIAAFTAFIGVNLAVVNLLPIPALDGGRILIIAITFIIEKIFRRKLNPKYEAYINNGAFVLLFGLLIFFVVNDIWRIASR
jgi:RIP metalloprotease RseP